MVTRVIETEADRTMLLRFLESHKLPFSAVVEAGRNRSTRQNRLQRQWINEIAEQKPENSAEEWRGICKLHFGVPIMRAESEDFCEVYDRIIRPMDYVDKLAMMMIPMDLPVTRIMSTKQKTAYLDTVHRHFSSLGVVLTDPGELLNGAKLEVAA